MLCETCWRKHCCPIHSIGKVINLLHTILRYLSLICDWRQGVIRSDLIGLVIDFQIKEATIDPVMNFMNKMILCITMVTNKRTAVRIRTQMPSYTDPEFFA